MAVTVLAAYDVRQDASRARLAAILQGFGDRVQKSVFVIEGSPEDLQLIRARAEALLDLGQAQVPEPTLFWGVW